MSEAYIWLATSSGVRIMTTSASAAAGPTSWTGKPAASAFFHEMLSRRSPMRTSMPLSRRLRAWAWPWLP